MIKFLALQIKLGRITIGQVPEKYRAALETALGAEG